MQFDHRFASRLVRAFTILAWTSEDHNPRRRIDPAFTEPEELIGNRRDGVISAANGKEQCERREIQGLGWPKHDSFAVRNAGVEDTDNAKFMNWRDDIHYLPLRGPSFPSM
ncbi:MAG: hypothetical protein C0497_16375 [Gemmatimonas sp.]|nr:hypothetical protein [Gemmatimonas sp.]